MPEPALISYLTNVHFGAGAVAFVGGLLRSLGVKRPLVVTDEDLAALGMPERLGLGRPAVFSHVPANPTEASVVAGAEIFARGEHDGLVAVGGGSPIDCAKGISLLATHPPPLEQYALIRGGLSRIRSEKPPLVAVPTTAGTGSEVGRAALIWLTNGTKLGFISPHMIPTAAVCDPELTLGLPASLTAATGMDAISHCVETFCSPRFNPVAEAIALDGLARAWRHLPKAVESPERLENRSGMMMAALEGGLTFQKGLGLVHSLSHPLGALPGKSLHHGTLNAILLPHTLRFNAGACPAKMNRMAEALGLRVTAAAPVDLLAGAFADLTASLGLPTRLRDLGVEEAELEPVIAHALADHSTATNPRAVTEEAGRQVLREAY